MLTFIATMCVWSGLGSEDYQVREQASAYLLKAADFYTVRKLPISKNPEVLLRMRPIVVAAAKRELELLSGGSYPEADTIAGWTVEQAEEGQPPEFYYNRYIFMGGDYNTWQAKRVTRMKERTRGALLAYLIRTGDRDTVVEILSK